MAFNIKALGITPELPISEWERTAALSPTDSNSEEISDGRMQLQELSKEEDYENERTKERLRKYRESLLKTSDKRSNYQRWLDIL